MLYNTVSPYSKSEPTSQNKQSNRATVQSHTFLKTTVPGGCVRKTSDGIKKLNTPPSYSRKIPGSI